MLESSEIQEEKNADAPPFKTWQQNFQGKNGPAPAVHLRSRFIEVHSIRAHIRPFIRGEIVRSDIPPT